jgi:hypothetical protein
MDAPSEASARPPLVCAALFAICAALSALACEGVVPLALLPWTAGALLFLGAGLPVLLRWSPVEASPLKLLLLGSLLSPVVMVALFLGARAWLPPEQVWTGVMVAVGVLQLAAVGRRTRFVALGRAAWIACGLSALIAALVALLLFDGNAPRLLHDGAAWHVGVVQSFARSWPAENPWLAGTPLPTQPAFDVLLLVMSSLLATAPSVALGIIAVWASATVPLTLYLLAAPLWNDGKRVLLAVLFGLFAWNALGGLIAGWPADWTGIEGAENWSAALAGGTPGAARGSSLYGLAAFVRVGPLGAALAYALAGWLAAAHSLRHGRRPWTGLTGVLHGAALLLHPLVGAAAALATIVSALAVGCPRARLRLPLTVALWSLPAFYIAGQFSWNSVPSAPRIDASWTALGLGAALLACAAGGLLTRASRAQLSDPGTRPITTLLVLGALIAMLGPFLWSPAAREVADLQRLGSFALAVLAAGGLMQLLAAPARLRALGVVLALALAGGGALAQAHGWGAHRSFARARLPISEVGGVLTYEPAGEAEDVGKAYTWLYAWAQALPRAPEGPPVLVREVDSSFGRYGGNFTPHFAALYADLPMWCERRPDLSPGNSRWSSRHERVQGVFRSKKAADPMFLRELQLMERSAVFVVEQIDRDKTRGAIEGRLLRAGATLLHVSGDVSLYYYDAQAEGQ